MSYTNLLYHIVYATKERAPLITNILRPRLHEYLGGIVRGLGSIPIEINGVSESRTSTGKVTFDNLSVRLPKQVEIKLFNLGETTSQGPLCLADPLWCFHGK
jgi:hypothetical protein